WLIANDADLELFSLQNTDYFGKTDAELAEFTDPIYKEAFLLCVETDEKSWQAKTLSRGNEVIPTVNGTKKVYDVIKVPLFKSDGARKGLVVLGRDITERKQAEEEIKIARERLGITNSILRHDITNDLIVINSAVNLFNIEHDPKMLSEIQKQVQKSLDLIERHREQESFIDSHSNLKKIELVPMLNNIIKDFDGIEISISGKGTVYGDNEISSVFENLINNSINHGKATKVDIEINPNEELCEIKVRDNGSGIPDEIKYNVFDKGFFSGESGHTGIGLYVVEQTIRNYGGNIFVEDNQPSGAVFVISLRKGISR
ncbi:MAG: ATP-binding protein, partial [Candidatus Cloacimonadota bacterium]|nr:ATP-binding protein [Candidatus Cloacimonadota bacterium]